MGSPKDLAALFYCSSILEEKTYQLYYELGRKVSHPILKSMILGIASDSKKHSKTFEELSKSLVSVKPKTKQCQKVLGPTWENLISLKKEIVRKESIDLKRLHQIMEKLALLEYSLSEEYQIFVQLKTLQFMTKEVNQSYDVNLKNVEYLFKSIIDEEQEHREILLQIMELSKEKEEKLNDNAPMVKYQNPDAWYQVPTQT